MPSGLLLDCVSAFARDSPGALNGGTKRRHKLSEKSRVVQFSNCRPFRSELCRPHGATFHSYLSATMGSTRIAPRDGG
jgi:hypothetical protein